MKNYFKKQDRDLLTISLIGCIVGAAILITYETLR